MLEKDEKKKLESKKKEKTFYELGFDCIVAKETFFCLFFFFCFHQQKKITKKTNTKTHTKKNQSKLVRNKKKKNVIF